MNRERRPTDREPRRAAPDLALEVDGVYTEPCGLERRVVDELIADALPFGNRRKKRSAVLATRPVKHAGPERAPTRSAAAAHVGAAVGGLLVCCAAVAQTPSAPQASPSPDAGAAGESGAASVHVAVRAGGVSLRANGAALAEVLRALAGEAGFKLSLPGTPAALPVLTDAFDGLPLERALVRILAGTNHAIARTGEGDAERIDGVYVLGVSAKPAAVARPAARAASARQPTQTGTQPPVSRLPPEFLERLQRRGRAGAAEEAKIREFLEAQGIEELLTKAASGEGLSDEETERMRTLSEELMRKFGQRPE